MSANEKDEEDMIMNPGKIEEIMKKKEEVKEARK